MSQVVFEREKARCLPSATIGAPHEKQYRPARRGQTDTARCYWQVSATIVTVSIWIDGGRNTFFSEAGGASSAAAGRGAG
jgi:hypothetical protein